MYLKKILLTKKEKGRQRMAEKKKYPRGIYQRGNLLWLRYAGLDGKIVFEPTGTDKLRNAEAQLHKRKAEIDSGKQPEVIKIKNYSFRELAEEYVKWAERQRCFSRKIYMIKQLADEFGHYPLRRFDTRLVEQFQTGKLQKGLKPATVNRSIATLKHMFTKATDWNMVEDETLKRVRKAKLLEENNRRLRYLNKEECQTLINACKDHLKPIVITALNTGMRKEEILNLKWDNVDLKNGFILLSITKNGERREIPINATLHDTLTRIIRRVDVSHVFYDAESGHRYGNIRRSFMTACRKANIRDFHFHDLRHTFASQLVMAGIDLTTVKELLGHKTLTMTLRYAHLAPSHKVKAVDILDNAINETSTIQKLYKMKEVAND
ncbi:MAG: tyrosine-type recombinase/integrase [Smithellaceae bacterium]